MPVSSICLDMSAPVHSVFLLEFGTCTMRLSSCQFKNTSVPFSIPKKSVSFLDVDAMMFLVIFSKIDKCKEYVMSITPVILDSSPKTLDDVSTTHLSPSIPW